MSSPVPPSARPSEADTSTTEVVGNDAAGHFARGEENLPPLATGATTTVDATPKNGFDRFFEITRRGSTIAREIRGGVVTFVTMAYIVILNPLILGGVTDVADGALDAAQIGAATGLTAGVMTILFGVVARLPFALAAGLGAGGGAHAGSWGSGFGLGWLLDGVKGGA